MFGIIPYPERRSLVVRAEDMDFDTMLAKGAEAVKLVRLQHLAVICLFVQYKSNMSVYITHL